MDNHTLTNRSLTADDAEIICHFVCSSEELFYLAPTAYYPWTADQLLISCAERAENTVFCMDEQIIGFANFYHCGEDKQAFIGNVIVAPAFRSMGMGKMIIKHMLKVGFDTCQFDEIHVSCFSSNTPGLLLYKKLGFIPYGIEQRTNQLNKPVALLNFKHTPDSFHQHQNTTQIDIPAIAS